MEQTNNQTNNQEVQTFEPASKELVTCALCNRQFQYRYTFDLSKFERKGRSCTFCYNMYAVDWSSRHPTEIVHKKTRRRKNG